MSFLSFVKKKDFLKKHVCMKIVCPRPEVARALCVRMTSHTRMCVPLHECTYTSRIAHKESPSYKHLTHSHKARGINL